MSRPLVALTALVALAAPAAARPDQTLPPLRGSFDLMAGTYNPNVDSEFNGAAAPWGLTFGGGREWLFRGGWEKALVTGCGTLGGGIQLGWYRQSGNATLADGTPSGDRTSFFIIPTSLTLTYRFDFLSERWGIPLSPYARVALERYNWWITNGTGKTVKTGATNGVSFAGGLSILLDFFDPGLAREMWRDSGIQHAFVFAELRKTKVDDFGSKSSWVLSDDKWSVSGGLLFEY